MKNLILTACMAVLCAIGGAQAQTAQQPCDCDTLTDVQPTTYRLLTSDNCYLLEECYIVESGQTLEIEPGTVIFGDVNTKGSLIIERGGTLIADGQPNPMLPPAPIIFTSSAPVNTRAPGDWVGITILGYAINNVPITGTINIDRSCGTFTGGGNDDEDNSGILRYVQIHYAGGGVSGDDEVNGLTLVSVGNATVLDHIQITHSATDAFAFLGGAISGKYLAAYNNTQNDYRTTLGYTGNMQFGLSLRVDPLLHDVIGSSGIVSLNNDLSSGDPRRTTPVFSNFTLFGPDYCDESELDEDIHNGILLRNNTAGSIYNTVVAGWPTGFQILGASTIANANDSGFIKFSYNTFYNNVRDIHNNPAPWNPSMTGCTNNMSDWIFGIGGPCTQEENQTNPSFLGYSNTICDDYCSELPDFSLSGESDLDIGLDDLGDPFFTSVEYRGAFDDNDWTVDWTNWCPNITNYCPPALQRSSRVDNTGQLHIAPNPASGIAYALFDAGQTGKVTISVLDKVSGQPLRTISGNAENTGAQRFAIPANGLQPGVYVVKVILPDGSVLTGQLFVL